LIHEDARILAVAKPAGQLVIPARRPEEGEPLVSEAARSRGGRLFVIHRLDRDASGVVVFAKDAEAHRALSAEFEGRTAKKTYLAAVLGRPNIEEGTVDEPIREFGSGRMGVGKGGKPSRTGYRVLERFPDSSLLEAHPETGRRHQIRVHLYSIGHPILGDRLYGEKRPVRGAARLMLHALELELQHPDGGALKLRAEPPADFEAVLASL
jgi:RluA family pseudouridine synthase